MFTSVFTRVPSVEYTWLLYTHFQHRHCFPVWTLPLRRLPTFECTAHSWSLVPALRVPPILRVGRDSSVSIVTHYWLDGSRGSGFPHLSWPALGPTILLYHGYRVSFSEVQHPGRGFYHPPVSGAEVKEGVYLYLPSSSGPLKPGLWRT